MAQKDRRAKARIYNASQKGIARNLRCEHGLDKPTSEHWAGQLLNPGAQCAICGLPTYLITVYRERGWPWFLGRRDGPGSHPRLTLDHIVPGDNNGGLRLLCYVCNALRGACRMTDEDVLVNVRDKWQWFSGPRFLWWLNTSPGVGGRLHRSIRCAKRDAQYAAGASPEPPPTANETNTLSPSPNPFANYVG